MISFIVIGFNEENYLNNCLLSVFETINKNEITDYEVIYVDSNSTDNSIDIALSHEEVKVIKLIGKSNSADARNVGASNSSGDILIFIDGDMQLQWQFINKVIDVDGNLIYNFVSGQFINFLYDNNGKFLSKKRYFPNLTEDRYEDTTGGLFIINHFLWKEMGGMKSKYRKSQDLDFGFRMAKNGHKLLRKKEIMAFHHTVDYKNRQRMWKDLFRGNTMYGRGLLYREHLANKYIYKRIVKSDGSSVMLFFILLLAVLTGYLQIFILYFFILAIVIMFQKEINFITWFNRLLYYFIRDILTLFSFFFFWPKSKSKYNVKKIN